MGVLTTHGAADNSQIAALFPQDSQQTAPLFFQAGEPIRRADAAEPLPHGTDDAAAAFGQVQRAVLLPAVQQSACYGIPLIRTSFFPAILADFPAGFNTGRISSAFPGNAEENVCRRNLLCFNTERKPSCPS